LPEETIKIFQSMEKYAQSMDLPIPLDLTGDREYLRSSVEAMADHVKDIDSIGKTNSIGVCRVVP